jgi:hypothetical protein
MKTKLSFIFFLSLFFIASSNVSANGFYCDGKLISVGDTKYEVLGKCGEPDFIDVRTEKRVKRDYYRELVPLWDFNRYSTRQLYREPFLVVEEVVIEEWTYNFGPTRFIRYLTFENGKLVNIVSGDYGF